VGEPRGGHRWSAPAPSCRRAGSPPPSAVCPAGPRASPPLDINENLRYNEGSIKTDHRGTGGCPTLYSAHAAVATSDFARKAINSTVRPRAGPRRDGFRIAARNAGSGANRPPCARGSAPGLPPGKCQQIEVDPGFFPTAATAATVWSSGDPAVSLSFALSAVSGPSASADAASFGGSSRGSRTAAIRSRASRLLVDLRYTDPGVPMRIGAYEHTTT
jgi:hypothetical protein